MSLNLRTDKSLVQATKYKLSSGSSSSITFPAAAVLATALSAFSFDHLLLPADVATEVGWFHPRVNLSLSSCLYTRIRISAGVAYALLV